MDKLPDQAMLFKEDMTSIEQKILAGAVFLSPDEDQKQNLNRLMHGLKNTELLIDMACKEGLACLLYKNLLASGAFDMLDPGGQKILYSCYYQTLALNLKRITELKQILFHLNQKKITVVLLQGISLLGSVYKDFGLRPMVDIDLWILKENYLPLVDTLKELGYRKDPIYPRTFKKGLTKLDLHTHILGADRIDARKLILAQSQNQIYYRTRTVAFEGQPASCLNRYDQVVYLCLHALKHNVNQLIWLVDVKNLVADWQVSDWQALMDRAGKLGQQKSIFYFLFLLSQHLDFALSIEIRRHLKHKKINRLEKWALKQREKQGSLPFWAPLMFFSPEKGLRQRFCFTKETLFPKPSVLRQAFNDSRQLKDWQLYAKRFLQLSGKAIMFIRR